jgi:hypothetical protein
MVLRVGFHLLKKSGVHDTIIQWYFWSGFIFFKHSGFMIWIMVEAALGEVQVVVVHAPQPRGVNIARLN